jgi:hypothetical protein
VLSNRGLAWLAGRAGSRPVLLPMVG